MDYDISFSGKIYLFFKLTILKIFLGSGSLPSFVSIRYFRTLEQYFLFLEQVRFLNLYFFNFLIITFFRYQSLPPSQIRFASCLEFIKRGNYSLIFFEIFLILAFFYFRFNRSTSFQIVSPLNHFVWSRQLRIFDHSSSFSCKYFYCFQNVSKFLTAFIFRSWTWIGGPLPFKLAVELENRTKKQHSKSKNFLFQKFS